MDMINNFIGLTLQLSVPIILGALCGTIAERGGIILLGVEGIMLIGAFAGAAGSYAAGSAMAGVLLSVVLGGMIGWFYALFCLKWKAHQSVVGVGINLFASGITAVMLKAIWQTEGMSESVPSISNLTIPGLSGIPVIGPCLKTSPPISTLCSLLWLRCGLCFIRPSSDSGTGPLETSPTRFRLPVCR